MVCYSILDFYVLCFYCHATKFVEDFFCFYLMLSYYISNRDCFIVISFFLISWNIMSSCLRDTLKINKYFSLSNNMITWKDVKNTWKLLNSSFCWSESKPITLSQQIFSVVMFPRISKGGYDTCEYLCEWGRLIY